MLHISTKGNQPFDLTPNQGITITASNPALDRDNIQRVFSLPITLPASPRNLALRMHANRLDARSKPDTAGIVKWGPHTVAEGDWRQVGSSDHGEEIQFASKSIDLWDTLGDIKINTILATIPISYPSAAAEWILELGAPSTGITYAVQLNTIAPATAICGGSTTTDRDTAGASLRDALNVIAPGIATYQPSLGRLVLQSAIVNTYNVTTLTNITVYSVVTVGEKAHTDMGFHVQDANTGAGFDTHVFPSMVWLGLYGTTQVRGPLDFFYDRVNIFADGTLLANPVYAVDETYPYQWLNTVIPMVRVPYILTRICEEAGFAQWAGDFWEDTDFQQLVIVNNLTLDQVYDDFGEDGPQRINGYSSSINLNHHVPELSAADFIARICTSLRLQLRIVGNTLAFVKSIDQVNARPHDWRALATAGHTKDTTQAKGWKLMYSANNDLASIPGGQLATKESPKGTGVKVEVIATTWHRSDLALPTHGLAKMPQFNQPGVSPAITPDKMLSTLPLCWIFDRGLQESSAGHLYRLATQDATNYLDESVGNWSLEITGPDGVYYTFHAGLIELSDADVIKIGFTLTIGDIQKVLTWENSRIRVYQPTGDITAVIKSISAPLMSDHIGVVTVEMLRQ